MTEKLRQIICPVCGRGIGRYSPSKRYRGYRNPEETIDYLQDYLKRIYDLDRSYFATEQEGGRNGFKRVTHLRPEDWPEGWEVCQEALFRAIKHYYQQDWISISDILKIFK